jgi:hypothetical protein
MQAAQATEANLPVKKAVKIVVLTMDVDEADAVEVVVNSTDIAPLLEGKKTQPLHTKKKFANQHFQRFREAGCTWLGRNRR